MNKQNSITAEDNISKIPQVQKTPKDGDFQKMATNLQTKEFAMIDNREARDKLERRLTKKCDAMIVKL